MPLSLNEIKDRALAFSREWEGAKAERVVKILAHPDSPDVPRLEAEIDKLVYALYSLTPEEIAIVEGKK